MKYKSHEYAGQISNRYELEIQDQNCVSTSTVIFYGAK